MGNSQDATTTRTVERGGKTYTQDVFGQKHKAKKVEPGSTHQASDEAQPDGGEVVSDTTPAVDPNVYRIAELEEMAAELLSLRSRARTSSMFI